MGEIRISYSIPSLLLSKIGIKRNDSIKYKVINAIWDTGANITMISDKFVKELMLERVDKSTARSFNGLEYEINQYNLDICIPEIQMGYSNHVVGSNIMEDTPYDAIIGLDIISQGDFHYYKKDNKYILEFDFEQQY